VRENVILSGLQTARHQQYLCLSVSPSVRFSAGWTYILFDFKAGAEQRQAIFDDELRQALRGADWHKVGKGGGECGHGIGELRLNFRKESADFVTRAALESALRELLAIRVGKAAHLSFDRGNLSFQRAGLCLGLAGRVLLDTG
jgi:hypothetical protein